MRCIYCSEREGVGREHYLPQCLGRFDNFQPLLDRICERCNDPIKQIEQEFCRRSPQAAYRKIFWVRDKGKKRGIGTAYFQPVKPGGQHMELAIEDPETGELLNWQPGTAPNTCNEISQVVIKFQDGRHVRIPIPVSVTTGNEMGSHLNSLGVYHIDTAYICAASGDEDRIQAIFTQMGWQGRLARRAGGALPRTVILRVPVSRSYARAIAKIAFHYALKFIPTIRGDEPEFQGVRDFIRLGIGNADGFVVSASSDWDKAGKGHLLDVRAPFQGEIEVGVKFFTGLDQLDFSTWLVHLGMNPSRLLGVMRATRHFTYRECESGFLVGGPILELN